MALAYNNTADGLIQRFRNNDTNNVEWTIGHEGWGSLLGWTPSQGRDVSDAAGQNTSIQCLEVHVVDQMTDEAVDVFAIIVGRLRRLNQIKIAQAIDAVPVPMGILDKLFAAIAACPSIVNRLDCNTCVTPRGLHAIVESFPKLQTLEFWVPRHPPQDCQTCAGADGFALAFANAAARGLPSLRNVFIVAEQPNPLLPTLLSALHMSSSVTTVDIDAPLGDDHLVRAARSFCTCTKSVQEFVVRGHVGPLGMTDVSALFDINPIPSFSPTVTRMEFYVCDFSAADTESLVRNAVNALQNVQSLCFGRCQFPSAMKVVQSLPRLRKLSCLSRDFVNNLYEPIADVQYDPRPYMLVTNQDLEDLCGAVERPGLLLNEVELDLVSSNGESFPAIVRLMGASRGRLILNLGEHSWRVAAHLVGGAHRLRRNLTDLRLRFVNCELEDPNYADIVGFDPNNELESIELSSAAILGLIDSNKTLRSLSLRGLRPNEATEILEGIMPVLASTNRTLRSLELHGGADLADILPRARALALDMLKENDVISTLEGFDIPKGGPLDNLLLQNRYGRVFLRANDPTPVGIWATVLARVSRYRQIGVMYKFLRAKPSLIRLRPVASSPARGSSAGRKRGRGQEE